MTANNIETLIRENAEKYYNNGTQILSDEAFDALIEKVKKENPDSEVLTIGWGFEPGSSLKINHKYTKIGSLDKTKTLEEINKIIKDEDSVYYDITPKLDGLSVVLYYKDGLLERALTRGNGECGIDITSKVNQINPYLSATKENDVYNTKNFTGAIRGEIIMTNDNFEAFKVKYPEARNPRNSAAGIINKTKNVDYSDFDYLDILVYTVVAMETEFLVENTEDDIPFNITNLRRFMNAAFGYDNVAVSCFYDLRDPRDYKRFFEIFRDNFAKDFPIDGIVLTNTNLLNKDEKGVIEYKQCAYKFQDEVKVGTVDHIEWTASKNNNYIPVVVLEEDILLEGTYVKRVSGYNARFIVENQIRKGSLVYIKKANQIIPKIVEVTNLNNKNEFELPTKCESCGKDLVWDENKVNLYCANVNCENQSVEDFKAWCLNLAPVDNLGWKTIKKLLENQNVLDNISIDDIYNENIKKFDIKDQKGEKYLFNVMLEKLQNDKIKPSQFLLALNIPGLGKKTAEKFDNNFRTQTYFEYFNNEIKGSKLGDELFKLIQDQFLFDRLVNEYNAKFRHYYAILKDRLVIFESKDSDVEYKGDVVITGKLSVKRDDFVKNIESKGWVVKSKVNKDTKILITSDKESNTVKSKDADKYGVLKLTEEEFVVRYM